MDMTTFCLQLDACGDERYGDDPDSRPIGVEPAVLRLKSYAEAGLAARSYIERYSLGPGYCPPTLMRNEHWAPVAEVAFNGQVIPFEGIGEGA